MFCDTDTTTTDSLSLWIHCDMASEDVVVPEGVTVFNHYSGVKAKPARARDTTPEQGPKPGPQPGDGQKAWPKDFRLPMSPKKPHDPRPSQPPGRRAPSYMAATSSSLRRSSNFFPAGQQSTPERPPPELFASPLKRPRAGQDVGTSAGTSDAASAPARIIKPKQVPSTGRSTPSGLIQPPRPASVMHNAGLAPILLARYRSIDDQIINANADWFRNSRVAGGVNELKLAAAVGDGDAFMKALRDLRTEMDWADLV